MWISSIDMYLSSWVRPKFYRNLKKEKIQRMILDLLAQQFSCIELLNY